MVSLKKANRDSNFMVDARRDALKEEFDKVKELNTRLQNDLYEQALLQQEIQRCEQYTSSLKSLELLSDSELPPEIQALDPHRRTLAKLSLEIDARKRLVEELRALKEKKVALQHANASRHDFLAGLAKNLKAIEDATAPLREHFGTPTTIATALQRELAVLLPKPLYILYFSACAYGDAYAGEIDISISGSKAEAEAFDADAPSASASASSTSSSSSSSSSSNLSSSSKYQDSSNPELYRTHPLSVNITVKNDDLTQSNQPYSSVVLRFQLFTVLHIVGVTIERGPKEPTLLESLYPGDNGAHTPNPACHLLVESGRFQFAFHECKPYFWAQRLCGLEFLPAPTSNQPLALAMSFFLEKSEAMSQFGDVVARVRHRLNARSALRIQLRAFSKFTVPLPEAAQVSVCALKRWATLTAAEFFQEKPYDEAATPAADYFRVVIRRNRNEPHLEVLCQVTSEYPTQPPLFKLRVIPNADIGAATPLSPPERTDIPEALKGLVDPDAMNVIQQLDPVHVDSSLRAIEAEVNAPCAGMDPNSHEALYLLSRKMLQLFRCFDAYLSTIVEGASAGVVAGSRKYTGRDRHSHIDDTLR